MELNRYRLAMDGKAYMLIDILKNDVVNRGRKMMMPAKTMNPLRVFSNQGGIRLQTKIVLIKI